MKVLGSLMFHSNPEKASSSPFSASQACKLSHPYPSLFPGTGSAYTSNRLSRSHRLDDTSQNDIVHPGRVDSSSSHRLMDVEGPNVLAA